MNTIVKVASRRFTINQIVQSLFGLEDVKLRESIINAPHQPAKDYVFGEQPTDDARLVPSTQNYAYNAVMFAGIREANPTSTVFDQSIGEAEDDPYDGGATEHTVAVEPMTYAQAQQHASAFHAIAESLWRRPECQRMLGWTTKDVVKDANGLDVVKYGTVTLVKSFKDWIADRKATTPADSPYYAALVEATQYGLDVPAFKDGVNEAMAHVKTWMGEVPWTPEGHKLFGLTRAERIVGKAADNRYLRLVEALGTKDDMGLNSALRAWNLMVYSPLFAADMAEVKGNVEYQLLVADETIAKQEAMLAKVEKAQYIDDLKAKIAERQAALDARMAKLLGEQKPEQPAAQANVTALPRPNVVNSR